jgi:hypothetical protein
MLPLACWRFTETPSVIIAVLNGLMILLVFICRSQDGTTFGLFEDLGNFKACAFRLQIATFFKSPRRIVRWLYSLDAHCSMNARLFSCTFWADRGSCRRLFVVVWWYFLGQLYYLAARCISQSISIELYPNANFTVAARNVPWDLSNAVFDQYYLNVDAATQPPGYPSDTNYIANQINQIHIL